MTRFQAIDLGLEVIRGLRGVLPRVRRRSVDLADQVDRASASVVLNLGEGQRRVGRDRLHHYRTAAGSADEVRCALWVAEAMGCLTRKDTQSVLALIDRVCALLWTITQGKRRVP